MKGSLYIVSTPIGNVEDITLRALRILKEVPIVAAENPGRTEQLFRHYGIETPLTGYHNLNQHQKTPVLLTRLQEGQSVALVSDEGTPLISDPGSYLVAQAVRSGIRVVPVPGPTAILAAWSASGLSGDTFIFQGFLPRTARERRRVLKIIQEDQRTQVLFERSPCLGKTLEDLSSVLGARPMIVARNLTGPDEEFFRGTARQIKKRVGSAPIHGNVTLVVKGKRKTKGESGKRIRRTGQPSARF